MNRIFAVQRLFITLVLVMMWPFNLAFSQSASLNLSLAENGCLNVVIANDFAYAACDDSIEVVDLSTFERRLIPIAADDISADVSSGLLFTQSGRNLTMLSLNEPFQPTVVATSTTNFSVFSGVSASSGLLAVSGGAGSSDKQIYSYTSTTLTLQTDGITEIDNTTGNPDVHLAQTPTGVVAYYSQDIGGVANFAIQTASLSNQGQVTNIGSDVVLTPGRFNFGLDLGPANFPVESEFLNNRLYIAHFAAQGLEVINTTASNGNQLENVIPLPFEPTNVATNGTLLFVVGSTNNTVAVVDPVTQDVIEILVADQTLIRPTGIAASSKYIVVADRENGLVVIERALAPSSPALITPIILLLLEGD